MNKSILIVAATACLVFLLCGPLAAQQKSAEEILAYFPQGRYMSLRHFNLAQLQKGKSYQFYKQNYIKNAPVDENTETEDEEKKAGSFFIRSAMSAPTLDYRSLEIPEIFQRGLVSITEANPLSLTEVQDPEGKSNVHSLTLESKGPGKTDKVGIFITESNSISVFEYEDLQSNINEALEKGNMVKTGKKLFGRNLYSFNQKRSGSRTEKFAWATPDNKLLVASDLKYLRKMIQSKRRKIASLVDSQDYIDLLTIFPDLGPAWNLMSSRQSSKELLEALEMKNLSNERIDEISASAEKQPFFRVSTAQLSDSVKVTNYEVYDNSSAAEEAMEKKGDSNNPLSMFPGGGKEYSSYQNEIGKRTKTELQSNVIVSSMILDEELIAMRDRANKAMAEALKANGGNLTLKSKDGKVTKMQIIVDDDAVKKKTKK